jgi:hypothetical protein
MDELPPPPAGSEGIPSTPDPAISATSPTTAVASPPSATPPSRRRWPIVVIVVGAVILVVGAIGAVVAATGDSLSSGSSSSTAAPSPSVAPPSTPTNLRATARSFQVKLTWHPGTEGSPATRYDIRRDGTFVGEAKASASSFTDNDAVPSEHYRYTVTAVGADQQRAVANVDVTTKGAPPGTAALVGTFNVHLHNTSHAGFSSFRNTDFSDGWRFQPRCKQPPCRTQLRNINNKKMVVSLKQNGGSYTGSTSVAGLVTCQGHDVTTSITVTIHATQADAVHDAWQITKFTGTMSQSASAQLGCTSSSASFTVTGTSLKH